MNEKVRECAVFQMDKIAINVVLTDIEFYIRETNNIITNKLNRTYIEEESKRESENYMEKASAIFDEDDDPGSVYENGYDIEICHYSNLVEMLNTILLALTASLYHKFEKKIKNIISEQITAYAKYNKSSFAFTNLTKVTDNIRNANFNKINGYITNIGINIEDNIIENIAILELIVNTYKHGNGRAHNTLSKHYPQFYRKKQFLLSSFDADDLIINLDQFNTFGTSVKNYFESLNGTYYRDEIDLNLVFR